MGGKNIVLSTNQKLRLDGLPYASGPRIDDPAAAVYFDYDGKSVAFACDRWDLLQDNLQAIAKTIEALRGIARWGTGDMVKAAFRGFTALPAPITALPPKKWFEVLKVNPMADSVTIKTAFRKLAAENHPDNGGDSKTMAEINTAYARAKELKGF